MAELGLGYERLHFVSAAAKARLGWLTPWPPVRRVNVETLFGFRLGPSAQHSAARKHERMRAVPIDDCELQVTVEWRGGDAFPHGELVTPVEQPAL